VSDKTNYRIRIYENYASKFTDAPKTFDEDYYLNWGRAQHYYLRKWLPLDNKAKILDLACGDGKLLYFFKRLGYTNITGVDISPEQVKLARQVTPNVEEANVLEWLEAHPANFDLITGLDIVEHLHKDEVLHFLDVCYGALKVGGRIVLQTPNASSPWGSAYRYNDFTHEVCFNPNSLYNILSLVGFQEIESRETNPVPLGHSVKSSIRYLIWQSIRLWLMFWNLVEIGNAGGGIFTRGFLISGKK